MRVTNVFKVIITAFIVITFTVSIISCKEKPPVVEEVEEKEEAEDIIIPETTKEIQETTPETTVEEEVFEEIVNAPEIEGLKFDQAIKTYIAEAGNPYGLGEGEVAGVYVKEAILRVYR